jgi:hypothetical protein
MPKIRTIDRNNFFKHTFCVFKEINPEEPEITSFAFKSKSGSAYYFTDNGVYRASNHWGRVGDCRWKLESEVYKTNHKPCVGFALWKDFFENKPQMNLYFIDWKANKPEINHCQATSFDLKYALFNAVDAKKRRKIIEMILDTPDWQKYLNIENSIPNQQKAIALLRTTQKTWLEIKRIIALQ